MPLSSSELRQTMLQLNKHGQAKRIKQRAEVEREDEVGPLGILSPISGVSFLF